MLLMLSCVAGCCDFRSVGCCLFDCGFVLVISGVFVYSWFDNVTFAIGKYSIKKNDCLLSHIDGSEEEAGAGEYK